MQPTIIAGGIAAAKGGLTDCMDAGCRATQKQLSRRIADEHVDFAKYGSLGFAVSVP